jgi:mannose-6-phosphate isomerase-like protein (cupin superfamily)
VEIHLGYGELQGWTVLGRCRAEVNEGYAMAIPPRTPHGFYNTGGHDHCLPFIFGSLRLGGWGIVLDVQSQPVSLEDLEPIPATDPRMNGMVRLDREIEHAAGLTSNARWTIVDRAATYRPDSGALVLSVARVTKAALEYPRDSFRIVAVARGDGLIRVGSVEREVGAHDHVGIPSGMDAVIQQRGDRPLVVLDAILIDRLKNDETTGLAQSFAP